jgi:adenylate kinase family enzyme
MRALIELLEKWADVRPASPNVHGMVTPNHLGVLPQRIGVPMAPPKPMTNSFSVADANFKPTPMPALPQTNASRPTAPVSNQPPPAPQLSGTNAYRSAATQPIRTPSRKTAEYRRHTGVADVNGEEYVNSEDVLLLGKLGFDLSDEEYGALEKTSEVLDIYSYLEKVAGIPKVVGKAVDKGLAFSGEFLKDMDYEVPKGYEIKGDLCCPIEKEKTASEEDYVFTHYNPHGKHKELKPLTYLELLKDRSRGRWENKPERAQKYVDDRKEFEATLGKELIEAGLPYDPEKSFLYGAVNGHERFGQPGAYQHLANMPDLNKTFFTINGLDDKDHIRRGKQGLLNAINLWKENQDKLKETEYMGMTIRPRVEVMTQEGVIPHTIKRLKEKTAMMVKESAAKPGLWANIRAKKARGAKAAKPGDEAYPDKKQWDKLSKAGAADPSQTILLTGHSGAGKSTLAKALAEKLNLPLHRVDAQTSWDDLRAHFEKNPELERKALTPGSAENKQYIRDVRKIVHKSLKEISGPAVLEGTQLTTLPANQLKKYKANILVGGNVEQSIAQRLQRTADKAVKKGNPFTPEQLDKKREESRLVADSWHPGMEKFRKTPGVIQYNHTEHKLEPLLEQLRTMMNKQAVAAWQRSEGKNPEGGLNAKGRASYKRETGGTLKAPVGESNPKGERAKRQNSFCGRMCGMKRVNTGSKAQNDPDSRINKSLRKWNCKCGEEHELLSEKIACTLKTAAADPSQTILITGHSGSGKTTLSRDLAERLKLPVRRVDAHRGWDNYIRGDDKRWKETLTAGTKENSYFGDLVRRATKDTLKNAPVAGVIEGTQLGHLPEEELAKFKAHIVVGGSRDQSILQRIKRSVDKASKQGVSFSPAEMETKKIKAEYVADYWEPGVEKFRKIPGVIHYNHTEDKMEPLVEKIKAILDKK